MRVVHNRCHGGFGLSTKAEKELGISHGRDINRTDSSLLSLIDRRGTEWCSGKYAKLEVFNVPNSWKECWTLVEYDGAEDVKFDGEKWLKENLEQLVANGVDRDKIICILSEYYRIKLDF